MSIQADQKPVGWMDKNGRLLKYVDPVSPSDTPLYTHLQLKREWQGLTDEEKSELWEVSRAALPRYATYASLVEAKLKEKNT